MKISDLLKESQPMQSPEWLEGYNAFWDGKRLEECPYDDDNRRNAWTNGWTYGSQED